MTRRMIGFNLLVLAATALSSGCCIDRHFDHHGCDGPSCAGPAHCDSCGGLGCASCAPQNPLDHLRKGMFFGGGCGEVYWDEWISDPPYCCDPCDDCGQWTGASHCPRWMRHGWRWLWGYRYGAHEPGCGCSTCQPVHHPGCGCDSCHGGAAIDSQIIDGQIIDGQIIEGEIIYDGPVREMSKASAPGTKIVHPTPSKQSVISQQAVPRPYYQGRHVTAPRRLTR